MVVYIFKPSKHLQCINALNLCSSSIQPAAEKENARGINKGNKKAMSLTPTKIITRKSQIVDVTIDQEKQMQW